MMFSGLMIGSIDYAACGLSTLYSDIKHGISMKEADGTIVNFIGIQGILYLKDTTMATIISLTDIVVPPQVSNLKIDGEKLEKNLSSFYSTF